MRGDTIRHQQMRRSELSQQLDYFATHVPDIVQLLIFIQQELPGKLSQVKKAIKKDVAEHEDAFSDAEKQKSDEGEETAE